MLNFSSNKYIVDGKKKDILDYDIVIILDTCRYDIFRYLNWRYNIFTQETQKAISPARSTPEFLYRIFKNRKTNHIYISANAYANSKGIPVPVSGCNITVKDHVKRVIDVWDEGLDEETSTVHPSEVNKRAQIISDLNRKAPLIVHYIQPHFPYLSLGGIKKPERTTMLDKKRFQVESVAKVFGGVFMCHPLIFYTTYRLGLVQEYSFSALWNKYHMNGIRYGHIQDTLLVMQYAKKLIDILPNRKIVITADHGEMLGEHGIYTHDNKWPRYKELVEVPWLEIN